ncbi:unnamed protein product [Rotaria sp. Silwood2]|nr:unnamed protein product [Rotaria sp. Silwood2]CAF2993151.1 unnamed protein product [Rotaria sp. Silwood2]CAF3268537.1 unnamed protein product [Rotaria sp. Silwood2]CAF3381040.1 unnamed protein product [Rotaria sp. Silwood2]CAF4104182.1 unnamed protein product [Rotaria sp. Silwood2]
MIFDSDAKNDDSIMPYSSEPSAVWNYVNRGDDKNYAQRLLCDKRISTNNWSTTTLRPHFIEQHNKTDLILSIEWKTFMTSTATKT